MKEKEKLISQSTGAQKCGTTSLYKYLKEHPSLYLPIEKEIAFFWEDRKFSRGQDWYTRTYFSGARNGQAKGEVSPQYMYSGSTAVRIYRCFPQIRILAILRHPVDRAYSHYLMAVRREQESRSFEQAARDNAEALCTGNKVGPEKAYLSLSRYGHILSHYFARFHKQNIKVLFLEELSRNPINIIREVFEFIGVDTSFIPRNIGKVYHRGGIRRFPWINWFLSKICYP